MTYPLASCSFRALGTTASIVSTDPETLPDAILAVRDQVDAIDLACSRFRPDSELMRLNDHAGEWVEAAPLLLDAIEVALRAAALTDGDVDPTVGRALLLVGYDRDFATLDPDGPPLGALRAAPGWRTIELDRDGGRARIPRGVRLDLGATAKAFAADRAAMAAAEATGAGGLGSLVRGGGRDTAAQLRRWSDDVEGRGACRMPDGTVRFVRSGLKVFSPDIERHRIHGRCDADPAQALLPLY